MMRESCRSLITVSRYGRDAEENGGMTSIMRGSGRV